MLSRYCVLHTRNIDNKRNEYISLYKKYEKLDVTTHPNNKFSRKLIEKIGGKEVGYKSASHYGNSEPRVIFEVSKQDFYQNCPFNKKMPDLLAVLINNKIKRK